MQNIIKLEFKRFNLKNHVFYLLIANIAILVLSVLTAYMMPQQIGITAVDAADLLIISVFLIWEAILIATIIVEEFRNKTIALLYTYPINRNKLITAKLALVLHTTFAFIIVSVLFQNACIFGLSKILDFISYEFSLSYALSVVVKTIATVFLGMLPLYFGMMKKSTIATIVSSVAIVTIVSNMQSLGGTVLIYIFIVFGAIGLFSAAITIKNIINNDLES